MEEAILGTGGPSGTGRVPSAAGAFMTPPIAHLTGLRDARYGIRAALAPATLTSRPPPAHTRPVGQSAPARLIAPTSSSLKEDQPLDLGMTKNRTRSAPGPRIGALPPLQPYDEEHVITISRLEILFTK
jgi:hypothetical protein